MKKYIILILIISIGVFAITSCKRSGVNDPDMTGPAGFRIILSGTADPSTLYVPESLPEVTSSITVKVLNNNGTPVINKEIVFQAGCYGYFRGYKYSDVKTTDSNGISQITYFLPPGVVLIGDTKIYLKVTLRDDGRLDNQLSQVYDKIPIRIIPYSVKEKIIIRGVVINNDGEGVGGVPISVSDVGVTLSGLPSGHYAIYVPWGWTGEITAGPLEGYTFIPANYTITTPTYSDLLHMDFIAIPEPVEPTLAASPTSLDFDITGSSSLDVTVYNSTTDSPINFIASCGATWIHIDSLSQISGTTTYTFTVTVDDNSGNAVRSGTITISSTTPGITSTVNISISQAGVSGP